MISLACLTSSRRSCHSALHRSRRRDGASIATVSRSLGNLLPAELVERLSQREVERRLGVALPFVTVDEMGRPHAMLLSYLEVRAYSPSTLGLVVQARSRTARNLAARGAGTLLIVEPDAVAYVKTRAMDGPLDVAGDKLGLGYFLLAVEEVLEDAAAEWESGLRITSAIEYRPVPALDAPWVRATLAALATPRVRV